MRILVRIVYINLLNKRIFFGTVKFGRPNLKKYMTCRNAVHAVHVQLYIYTSLIHVMGRLYTSILYTIMYLEEQNLTMLCKDIIQNK